MNNKKPIHPPTKSRILLAEGVKHLKKVDFKNPRNIFLYGVGFILFLIILFYIIKALIYIVLFGLIISGLYFLVKKYHKTSQHSR